MSSKEDLYNFISESMVKIAVFFYTSYGFPVELYKEICEMNMKTCGEQMNFINNFDKLHPNVI